MPLKYRPEINGLRAIAVFAVVFYHANLTVFGYEIFHGGFLGVDVFFVISGYLITSIIVSDIRNNSFSFRYFYERRIRRIIPALFFMLLFSLILAWLFLLPDQLENYSYSLLGSIFFYSNFHFHYAGLQYAAESSLKLPLLHTWSLAIEEQYYIIFPVALYLVSKYLKRYILAIFVLGFVGSLLLAHWASITHPSINFYSLPTRGWELLAGALLAELEIRYSRRSSRLLTQIMPALGLLMILFSIGVFNHQILHPSIYSLIPITGCVLLIWFCQRDGFITKILSNKLLVGMGLISYSLYLWHHPIFAFARITGFADEQIYKSLLLILICVLFACFTYYFVE
ncbi:acyltransferase, partial [bacterium]|nr:acyltransferase [bacterium]